MKSIHYRILAAAFAICLGLGVSYAYAQNHGGHAMGMHGHGDEFGEHMLEFFTDYLNLSDSQQKQIKEVMTREHAALKPLMEQVHQSHQQMHQYETGTFDEVKVRALATQQSQTMVELIVQKTRIHNELFQMLTAKQQAKMKEFIAHHESRMAEHMHDMPAPPEE